MEKADAMRISFKNPENWNDLGKSPNMGTLLILTTHQSTTVKESISILKLSFVELRPVCHSVSTHRCLIAYFSSVVNFSIVRFDWYATKLIIFLSLVIFKLSKIFKLLIIGLVTKCFMVLISRIIDIKFLLRV